MNILVWAKKHMTNDRLIAFKERKGPPLQSIFIFLLVFHSMTAYCVTSDVASVKKVIAGSEKLIKSCEDLDNKNCVIQQLSSMYKTDQMLREMGIKNEDKVLLEIMQEQDRAHTERLKKILNRYLWLKLSEFNSEVDKQAWLIAQHSDHDPEFQHRVLFILEKMVSLKETDPKNYAYLYDRVALKYSDFGVKQRYGTQAIMRENKIVIRDFEGSEAELDERRKEMGLEPIAKYLDSLNKRYS